jgi:hypothetical protein
MAKLFQVLSTAKLPDMGFEQRWAVEIVSEPEHWFPVHTAVVVGMSAVELAMQTFVPERIWYAALIEALPDDCFPPWAPI